jgi:hypothetical protein
MRRELAQDYVHWRAFFSQCLLLVYHHNLTVYEYIYTCMSNASNTTKITGTDEGEIRKEQKRNLYFPMM